MFCLFSLHNAIIQLNGTELVNQEEQWFRQHIALAHKGGAAAFSSFVYGYSFAKKPAEHQPSGTCNFSRIDNAELKFSQASPTEAVTVYAVNYNVLRIMSGMGGLAYSN